MMTGQPPRFMFWSATGGTGTVPGQVSGTTRFSLAGATPAEIENGNGDRVFIEIPPADRTGKEMGFDEIVLWRTPGHDICRAGQELFAAMNAQSGITLVEVAISVAIIGILMGGALELYQRARTQRQYETTYDNMDAIIQALSVYVETAGRLPCPADPAASDCNRSAGNAV